MEAEVEAIKAWIPADIGNVLLSEQISVPHWRTQKEKVSKKLDTELRLF